MNAIRQQTRRTVQSQVRDDQEIGIGLLFNMVTAGQIIPPWWSRQRDVALTEHAIQSDHFQSAEWMISAKLTNVPFRVEARDRSVKRHQKLADEYQAILENMLQFTRGWHNFWSPFLADLWTTDNGGFGEVLGPGNPGGPRKGPALGLAHLDSLRCTRTSNPEYPIYYQDVSGKRTRFHHTRVIYQSQYPSARADMYGVGHCWLTRAINNVQQLIDQDVYFQEALGSRPVRQMLLGRGIDPDDMIAAVGRAEEGMDNQGLSRYSKTVFVGDGQRTDIGIDTIPFTFLPDGYDKQQQTTLAMFLIALAGGFPPRWLWPATQAGATKADAMFQHISGSGGGALWHLNMMRDLLSYTDRALSLGGALPPKFLPKELRLIFDYQDDEQDRQQAEIKDTRANTRKTDLEDGVITVRVAREQALSSDDITEAQFNQMELQDGRLPDGADLLTLFDSADPLLVEMLDLGVDEPLLIDANDAIEMIIAIEAAALVAQTRMVQARSSAERAKAEQALEALGKLKGVYEEIVVKEIEEEIAAEQASGEFELPETPAEPAGEGEGPEVPEEETEEKAFRFGARVGERIRGGLFRGAGGKFASEGDISNVRSEILGRLIARLRGARAGTGGAAKKPKKPAGGGGGPSEAEVARKKREKERKNRIKIFDAAENLDTATMERLVRFIKGEEITPETAQALAQQGFVQFDASGNPVTTSAGRSIISAANKGDTRRVADLASSAQERVAKTRARADKKREQADTARERAADLTERAEAATADADELDDDAGELLAQADAEEDEKKADKLRVKAAKLQERAEKKREQAADLQERVTEQDERAAALDTEADQIDATVGAGEQPATAESPEGEAPGETKPPAAKPPAQKPPAPPPAQETQGPADRQTQLLQTIGESGVTGRMDPGSLVQLAQAGLIETGPDGVTLTEAGQAALKKKEVSEKTLDGFSLNVRAAVRGLWLDALDQFEFVENMISAIERGFEQAWNEGAAKCGISPDERTPDEEIALRDFINSQFPYLPPFAADIATGNRASGAPLEPHLSRGDLWIGRYTEAVQRGQAMACANQKLKWVLGAAEHCSTCLKLDGKVKRASFWNERGIIPRVAGAPYLECRGYNCQCEFVETDEPVSRGRLPNLP